MTTTYHSIVDALNDDLALRGTQGGRLREDLAAGTQRILMKEFGAGLAHELNQPLAAITSYAEGAARLLSGNPAQGAPAIDILTAIAGEALRAGDRIRRFRMPIELSFRRERIDCTAMLHELIPVFDARAERKATRLVYDLDSGPSWVMGDSTYLQVLVLLLFDNALDAVEPLPAERRQVIISLRGIDDGVMLDMLDSGGGVSVEAADRLFTPFFSTKSGRMGLSLAACQDIAQQHGGTLRFSNEPTGGARFVLWLPDAKEERTQ